MHIIDRSLFKYTYLLNLFANLGEKMHFTSAMKFTMLFNVISDYTEFEEFCSQRIGLGKFGFAYGGFVSLTLRIRGQSNTSYFSNFIVRTL